MEKPKIITSLGERRKEKQNKDKRTEVELSPGVGLLYPEDTVDITVEEALRAAEEVIKKYSDPEKLFEDFARRERANPHRQDYKELTDDMLREEIEENINNQKNYAKFSTTESLLKIFDRHVKHPDYYYGIMILASAKELRGRLRPPAS